MAITRAFLDLISAKQWTRYEHLTLSLLQDRQPRINGGQYRAHNNPDINFGLLNASKHENILGLIPCQISRVALSL